MHWLNLSAAKKFNISNVHLNEIWNTNSFLNLVEEKYDIQNVRIKLLKYITFEGTEVV